MRFLIPLLLSCCIFSVQAKTHVNLYQTQVAIGEQGEAAARMQGMQEVIVRATGTQTVLGNEVIQKATAKSARYVDQISYSQQGDNKMLNMTFSDHQIRSLISQAQLPLWPSLRKNILIWLVQEKQLSRNIVWEHSTSPLFDQIKADAVKRGLPLTLPVGDFDDVTNISVSDLWGNFTQSISQVSARYPTDAIVVVVAQGDQYRWTLYDRSAEQLADNSVATLTGSVKTSPAEFAEQFIDTLSEYYAQQSAVTVASESSLTVKVTFSKIKNAVNFFTLENALKGLDSVARLDILTINGDQATFNVHLLSNVKRFEQQVSSLGFVSQIEAPPEQEGEKNSDQPSATDAPPAGDEITATAPVTQQVSQ